MNIDERLEKLTGRHEALTLNIELMQSHWETRWTAITAALQQDAENIRALARIAELHDRRLSHLEDQAP